MVDLQVVRINGDQTVLAEGTIEEFKSSLQGAVLCPGDDGYEDARKIWNGMIDRRPAIIALCTGVADVVNCVDFARSNNLLVAVRGGAHSFAGNAVCDGGIVIDLSLLKGIRVDPVGRTARAEGGVKWIELDRETAAFGLATPGGTVSDTGIAGLTLGGGHGWLGGQYGLTCDNLISADVVTADGRFLIASATENTDLFWGLRGGGGNFGVVTSFEYQLHPLSPTLLAGMVLYPYEKAKEVLQLYRDFTRNNPDELGTMAALLTTPEGQPAIAIVVCYNGPAEAGEEILRPIREFGPPMADLIGPMSYGQVQTMLDAIALPGRQYYEKVHFIGDISDGAIDAVISHFQQVSSPLSGVMFQQTGGAMRRGSPDDAAYSQRDAQYNFVILSCWLDPGESEIHLKWTRELWDAMRPHSTGGVYVNDIGREVEEGADLIRSAYGESYQRLVALKNKYDPTNLFRHNQNIKPTV